jgi:hypothetical protein
VSSDDAHIANVELKVWKYGVLSGVVVDEAGEPAVDFQVRAVRRQMVAGRARLQFGAVARTNDLGEFRLAGLMPGDYTVFVPAEVASGPAAFGAGNPPTEWMQTMTGIGTAPVVFDREIGVSSADGRAMLTSASPLADAPGSTGWLAAPPTFLGGGMSAASVFVHVDSGQERGGLAVPIRRVATQSISGTLVVPGTTATNHVLHLLPADTADFPLFEVATAIADATGKFTFMGVPAGNYVIRVVRSPVPKSGRFAVLNSVRDATFVGVVTSGPPTNGAAAPPLDDDPLLFANESVAVGAQPVTGLVITLRPGVSLSGRAEFEGTSPHPPMTDLQRQIIQISPANGYAPRNSPYGRFSPDGSFKTMSLLPGTYLLRPPAPPGWTVKSVNAGGRDVTERAFDVTSDVTDIVVTYTDRSARVDGTVTASDRPLDAISVVLFPADRDGWADYGASTRRMALRRLASSGTFTFSGLPPGDYYLIALPESQTADWQDPAVLAKLAGLATAVTVRDGVASTITLSARSIR